MMRYFWTAAIILVVLIAIAFAARKSWSVANVTGLRFGALPKPA